MADLYLQQLGSNHAEWLSVRQSLVASNIANANVPGFTAKDVRPLEGGKANFTNLLLTDENHVSSGIGNVNGVGIKREETWETYHSGGNVSLPQEMMKSGEIATAYQLNTSVMRTFHRMVLATFGS